MYNELGGFAESPEVIDGDWEAFNFCLAECYLQAMGEENWEALGYMDEELVNDIARWLNYDGEIGKDRIDIIKNIPKGLIQTSKNRTFIDAIVAEHKAPLAQTFIYNGNHFGYFKYLKEIKKLSLDKMNVNQMKQIVYMKKMINV